MAQATPALLAMAADILPAPDGAAKPLILADKEHYSQELFAAVRQAGRFDLLCAVPALRERPLRIGMRPISRGISLAVWRGTFA